MDELYNKHYITIDDQSRILSGFSDAFRKPSESDICINAKGGYQFRLFPGGEENPALFDWGGDMLPLYRWDGSQVVKRTKEELEADRAARPVPENKPTELEQLRADMDYIAIMTGVEL